MDSLPNDRHEGERRRDAALSLLRTHRAATVRDLTRAAVTLAMQRDEITADDLRSVVPIPPGIRPCVVGAAVRDAADAGIIAKTGEYRRSCRAPAHARPNPVWRLADADAGRRWLDTHPPLAAPTIPPPTDAPPEPDYCI